MPSRRCALALAAGLFGLAGCVGDEPGAESSPSTASPTEAVVVTETPRSTNTCAEQFVFPDIEVDNERSTEQRLSVALVGLPANTPTGTQSPTPDAGEVLFERTYTIEAHGSIEEDERIFRDGEGPGHHYRFDCTVDGTTASLGVDAVASSPQTYGIHVEIGADGPELWTVHGDPGPQYNPNCY